MATKKKTDNVNHPNHYQGNGWETIQVIADVTKGMEGDIAFGLGNAIKYLCRAGRKNSLIEDLKKARWYLDYIIDKLTQEEEE